MGRNCSILQQGLEEEGYTVSSAADGSLAFEKNPKETLTLFYLIGCCPRQV
jgi:DNA-binding response OmpR family regulator